MQRMDSLSFSLTYPDQIFVNMLLTEEDFQQMLAYIRGHDLEEVGAAETMGDAEE